MVVALVQGLLGRDIQALRWAAIAVQLGIPEHIPPIPNIRSQAARRAGAYEEELRKAREIAMEELAAEATSRGADAVVGIDLDYETVGNGSMLMVTASGTAVRLSA